MATCGVVSKKQIRCRAVIVWVILCVDNVQLHRFSVELFQRKSMQEGFTLSVVDVRLHVPKNGSNTANVSCFSSL